MAYRLTVACSVVTNHTASRIFAERPMDNNLRHSYENDWLNMVDSVEFNFKCQQRCRPFLPSKYRVFSRQNKWLNYGQVFNELLPALPTRENVCQKCRDDDPLSEYGQRILGAFTNHASAAAAQWQPADLP